MTQTLTPFITDLLKSKGYSPDKDDVFTKLQKDLAAKLNDFIMIRTIKEFSKKDLQEFQTLLDQKKSKAELQQFAIAHIPDYKTFLAGILVEFEEVYLSST